MCIRDRLRAKAAAGAAAVRSEKLGEVADEFDSIHTIERALAMGSVDRIITAEELRPYICLLYTSRCV